MNPARHANYENFLVPCTTRLPRADGSLHWSTPGKRTQIARMLSPSYQPDASEWALVSIKPLAWRVRFA